MKSDKFTEIKFPQGSEQWETARLGRLTASDLPISPNTGKLIKGKALTDYMVRKYTERKFPDPKVFVGNFWTDHGNKFEPAARDWFRANVSDVREAGLCINNHSPVLGCSPDGLGDKFGLEIKCPSAATHAGWMLELSEPAEQIAYVTPCDADVETMDAIQKRAPKQWKTYQELPRYATPVRNYDSATIKALAEKGMVSITQKQGYKHQLPQDHAIQVHASMAILDIKEWWFLSYHVDPGTDQMAWEPIVRKVKWDWFTSEVELSLAELKLVYAKTTAMLTEQCPLNNYNL